MLLVYFHVYRLCCGEGPVRCGIDPGRPLWVSSTWPSTHFRLGCVVRLRRSWVLHHALPVLVVVPPDLHLALGFATFRVRPLCALGLGLACLRWSRLLLGEHFSGLIGRRCLRCAGSRTSPCCWPSTHLAFGDWALGLRRLGFGGWRFLPAAGLVATVGASARQPCGRSWWSSPGISLGLACVHVPLVRCSFSSTFASLAVLEWLQLGADGAFALGAPSRSSERLR